MDYQTRVAAEAEKWIARLNATAHSASRSRPVARAQYWLLGMIGSWATGPGLEAAYQRLLQTNTRARRTNADIATSRKRLELRISELKRHADKMNSPGDMAIDASQDGAEGQDEAAREVAEQLARLRRPHADMQVKEQRVQAASQRLNTEVNAFRTSKDAIKAAHRSAEIAARAVHAAVTGDDLAEDAATGEGAEPV